jgi:hypothetical protein
VKEEPVWLLEETILAVHDAQIGEHGGPVGLRDRGLLGLRSPAPETSSPTKAPASFNSPPLTDLELSETTRSWTATSERATSRRACSS